VGLHLDLIGDLASDMFAAGPVDLMPHLETGREESLRCYAALLDGASCRFERFDDGLLIGLRLIVERNSALGRGAPPRHSHELYAHADWPRVRADLEGCALDGPSKLARSPFAPPCGC
jgi:hypothetical protein